MNFKKSNYNILVPYKENSTIIFNPLKGSIGRFTNETLERFNKNELTDDEIKILLDKGILIDNDFDELNKINDDRKITICDNNLKHFRIWPTSACNARCYYCFEKGIKPVTMTKEVADATIKFMIDKLENNNLLSIEWFGGEPLVNVNIIDYIYSKIKPVCKEKNCKIFSTMITNGSLINESIAKKICHDWDIKQIQITLDGYADYYDTAKNYYNKKLHNFNTVINAIKLLNKESIKISIRMNYDMKNYDSIVELVNYLHNEFEDSSNITYYIYPLWSSTDEEYEDKFISKAVAEKKLLNIFDLLLKYNMRSAKKLANLNYKKHACFARNKNSYTILADGKITKCAETFKQVIGDIWDGIKDTKTFDIWTNTDLETKCKNCIYLPLCQGGCKSSYFTSMPQCFAFKDIIEDVIRWYVDKLEQGYN